MKGIEIRDISVQQQISIQAGFYRWFMPSELVQELRIPINDCKYIEDQGYLVYVGIAKNMRQRMVWHVTQKHLPSSVKSGFLSTLRQTLCGLAKVSMDDTDTVDRIINQMFVEFEYCNSKEEAHNKELDSLKNYVLPLNIMGNQHPFTKELKRLRKESKKKALLRISPEKKEQDV